MYQSILILAAIGLVIFGAVEFYQTGLGMSAVTAVGAGCFAFAYGITPRTTSQPDATWAWRNPLSTGLYIVGGLIATGGAIFVLVNVFA